MHHSKFSVLFLICNIIISVKHLLREGFHWFYTSQIQFFFGQGKHCSTWENNRYFWWLKRVLCKIWPFWHYKGDVTSLKTKANLWRWGVILAFKLVGHFNILSVLSISRPWIISPLNLYVNTGIELRFAPKQPDQDHLEEVVFIRFQSTPPSLKPLNPLRIKQTLLQLNYTGIEKNVMKWL